MSCPSYLSRTTLIVVLSLVVVAMLALAPSLGGGIPAEAAVPVPPVLHVPSSPTVEPKPTPRPPAQVRLPILMYHYISVPPLDADKIRVDLSVMPEQFEAQLSYLHDHGYTTVGLQDVVDLLSMNKPLPPRPIVLTFDDGYLDHYTEAFPLLQRYGMTGTFFVVTDYAVYRNPEHLTWSMISAMAQAGMSIQSHSRTHKDMRDRSKDFLVWEILGPVEQITYYAGQKPRFFCYPTGRFDASVVKILRDVGTLAAVTTEYGSTYSLSNAMTWPRLRVHNTTTIEQFAALVNVVE